MRARRFSLDPEQAHSITLVGLSSPLVDYKLAYFINKSVGIQLSKMEDINIYVTKKKSLHKFSFYFYHSDLNISFYLLQNRDRNYVVFHEYKQLDYFLIISSTLPEKDYEKAINNLRSVQRINLVSPISPSYIPDLDLVLGDIELHMTELTGRSNPDKDRLLIQ